MESDTKVCIYFGPHSWFDKQFGKENRQYFLDAVNDYDEAKRHIRYTVEGQESTENVVPVRRPDCLIVLSSDLSLIHI